MNIVLVIVGVILIGIAAVRGITKHNIEAPKYSEHGDQRIVKYGGYYWIEHYAEFPSWLPKERFETLEEARTRKAQFDAVRSGSRSDPEVVE